MSFSRVFKWNGKVKPYPTSFSFNKYKCHTEDSGESPLTGITIITTIGKKRKIEMKWDRLTEEECFEIAQIFEDDDGKITFADACTLGSDTTWFAYPGDFKADFLYSNEDDEFRYLCSLNFIEIDCIK